MHVDEKTSPCTLMIAFNGELVGLVHEADTDEGYIIQHGYETSGDKLVATGKYVRREGRVDVVGDAAKDSQRMIYERLNKIREELGLETFEVSPFFTDEH